MSAETVKFEVEQLANQFDESRGYLLYAMGLELGTDDYEALNRDCVIDGGDENDRKVDFFYLDTGSRRAVVAQSYFRLDWNRPEAPAQKASDLNTARAWLFDRPTDEIPDKRVQKVAQELRDALDAGAIDSIDFLYVHNLPESVNVREELDTLEASLRRNLQDAAWAEMNVEGTADEYGLRTVVSLQEQRESGIRVGDSLSLTSTTQPQQVSGDEWTAVIVTALASDLVALVRKYETQLYSSNVRDYLGSRATRNNINNQIQATAREHPRDFWAFNNGVTAVTHEITEVEENGVTIRGFSIVNGAQTVGSLARVDDEHLIDVLIPLRIVSPRDAALTASIIRFNNTQNPVEAWELRSIDKVQKRISEDFSAELGLTYERRRGQTRRGPDAILFEKLAPWLSAFYGDSTTPHRNKRDLYESDQHYAILFNNQTDVRNATLAYRVGEAVLALKDEYKALAAREPATAQDELLYGFFQFGAFQYALIQLIAGALQTIHHSADRRFPQRIRFSDDAIAKDRPRAIEGLLPLAKYVLLAVPVMLGDQDAYAVFRSREQLDSLSLKINLNIQQNEVMRPNEFDPVRALTRV